MPRALWSGMAATGATVLPAVPAIFRALSGVQPTAAMRLRLCVSAGAPLPSRVGREFFEAHGVKVRSFYGASECGGICFDGSDDVDLPDGFVGTPMRGVEVAPGGEGMVRVRSAALHAGSGGEFVPGDLLEEDAGGGLRIVGRVSEMVNVGGRKVNPLAVEAVLAGHPDVREVVVFGRGDASRAESLVAVVVGEVEVGELREWCAGRLAAWQVPREFYSADRIPVGPRGKVSRRELATALEDGSLPNFRLSVPGGARR